MAPITFAILTIALVAVTGLLIGNVRFRGIGLGPAGVLFAGILFGQFGAAIDPQIASFAKEFGLILFVFAIGLQLGPGVVRLWKQQGLLLNAVAFCIVLQGFLLVIGFHLLGMPVQTVAGLFSGATTNTPSLGAAEQAAAMTQVSNIEAISAAYAVAYPGGILGIILTMLLIRRLFRINVADEVRQLDHQNGHNQEPIVRSCVVVDNPRLGQTPFGQIPGLEETEVRISRIRRCGEEVVHPATEETLINQGDVVQVVGRHSGLDRFIPLLGHSTQEDLMQTSGDAEFRRVFVTESQALQRTFRELSLDKLFNATVTRIVRSGVEMTARGSSRFHYGDIAHIVGDRESLDRVTDFLGNSAKSLNETKFLPLFLGIALGVMAGMLPLYIPGVPSPVRLGLAGGPLVAAVVFSLIGSVGGFVWYIPNSANHAFRELGMILFLACTGLSAGETFFQAILSLQGLQWMLAGLSVTVIPIFTVAALLRWCGRQNYLTICGVIAGSMTDPPALAFANSLTENEACSTAYATVYPLTMILRIIAAQTLILLLG